MKRITIYATVLYGYIAFATGDNCPPMQKPCVCSSMKHEPIAIKCEKAASIDVAINALPKSLLYLDSLTISDIPIVELPPYIFKNYIIKKLILRNNGMLDIHPQAFDGNLDTLEKLEIRANKLGKIPQTGISSLQNLNTLIISEDNIPTVTEYSFNTWRSKNILQKLELNSNNLSTISKYGFTGLKSLKQLSLDKNLFNTIPTEALRPLVQLEELSMSVNQISQIPVASLPLPNLKSLSFEVNQISNIAGDAFQETPHLLYLYLNDNQFHDVDANMFYYINQLKVLALGNNPKITTLSANTFQYVPSLIRLELADCSISYIESGALQKAPKLQVIVLRNNQLTHIARTVFSSLQEVISIDARDNKIASVDDFAFSKLPSLRHLDISSNELQTLLENTFYGTYYPKNPPVTRILYLYDNPWKCDEKLQWFREWLRNNGDILLTAPGQKPASCRSPSQLNGLDMRQMNPYSITPVTTTLQLPSHVYNEGTKKTVTPKFHSPFENQRSSTKGNDNSYTQQYHKWYMTSTGLLPVQPQVIQLPTNDARMSQATVVMLVLGSIMGICILSILSAVGIKCIAKWRAHKRREDFQEIGESSAFSGFGSRYNSEIYRQNYFQQDCQQQQQPVRLLNRHWNWWF